MMMRVESGTVAGIAKIYTKAWRTRRFVASVQYTASATPHSGTMQNHGDNQ
ncbi:hypothetical protein NHH73_08510 [Oxalobacteraceae bacterium OTU3CINTB1]|nr:hypothetical protein NHH73_08510 [Oxalobacteraceae bacterium OTU3CINTB1]